MPTLADELARLDLLVHRETLRLRAAYQLTLDETRGVYVSDEQVDDLLRARAPDDGDDDDDDIDRLRDAADALRRRVGDDSPLGRVAARLGLDGDERDALFIALAPEIDRKYEALYAYLNNGAGRRQATVELIMRLAGVPRAKLHAGAPLVDQGLIEPLETSERQSELGRAWTIAPALAAELQGLVPSDVRLAGWVVPVAPALRLPPSTLAAIARALPAVTHATPSLVVIEAEPAQAPAAAAAELMTRAARPLLRVDGSLAPERLPLSTLSLVARLRHAGLLLVADEWSSEPARRALPGLLSSLWRARVPLVLAAAPDHDWRALVRELPSVRLRLDDPDADARRALWAGALADRGCAAPPAALDDVAQHFRLGPAPIDRAAAQLAITGNLGDFDGSASDAARERLFAAAREQSSANLGHLALPVPPRHRWSDLVLPPVILRRLREVAGAVRARGRVFGAWGFGRRGGSGLMALFAGSSGTGKTMSASVIAREIGLDLHRIELAAVISKYIGETEKNLHAIFEAARSANVILFFDEADALLGKRSEVKDAHDRHANVEVAYLLQKMEEHDGVVILASNLAKNMDPAFARRMHYVIEFPRPDAALRERLWRGVFPPEVPLADDIDFAFLARQFDLSGGEVRTIALEAAFLAAGQERGVAMLDLVTAVSRQMIKQGRPLGASDFKHYYGALGGS